MALKKSGLVKSRLVLNFPGFEGTPPVRQLDRMSGNGDKFAKVWNVDFARLSVEEEPENHLAVANFETRGPNWKTTTRLVQFTWHDIIAEYEGQPYPKSFFVNFPKYRSFFFDGTVFRYFKAHWRYGGFMIYPLLLIIIFGVLSWFVANFLVTAILGPSIIITTLLTLLMVMVLIKWPGDKLYMNLSINDWGFARDLAEGTNPAIERRYQEFADRIVEEINKSDHDEIIIAGHSFGTIWAVQALARVLINNPDILKKTKTTFLSLGSSLLKITLVPAASKMREMSKIVLSQPDLLWDETQTHIDLIAFHGTTPDHTLELDPPDTPIRIQKVRYSRVMDKQRYRKMRKSFYRSHRQYIMYQDMRCPFDFFLKCFGPLPIRDLATTPETMNRIDKQGQLHDDPLPKE